MINLSRLSDLFVGHMKAFVLILNAGCVITSFWFIIVAQQYVRFSKGEDSTGRRLLYFYTLVDLSASCMKITSELSNDDRRSYITLELFRVA